MYNEKQEKVFLAIDDVIERELSGNMNLKTYINHKMPALRKSCQRNFGSLKAALDSYGYIDETPRELSFEKLYDFIGYVFEVKEDGRIIIDFELFFSKINELTSLGYIVNSQKVIRDIEIFLELERIDAFMSFYNEKVGRILDRRSSNRYPENQIPTLVEKHFSSRSNLYMTYGVHPFMLNHGEHFLKVRSLMRLGSEFEHLVAETLTEINPSVQEKVVVHDCIPDFIVEDCWYDAKLSRSTALDSRCETIEKYRKHTDHLTIIYAINDTSATDSRANFVHIIEYKSLVSEKLQNKIDAFIYKASEVKFGCK